jgi:hypothetical protein
MAWIKRNKFFVIIMAVGLICIGGCGYLFWKNLSDASAQETEYAGNLAQYTGLVKAPIPPTDENTQNAKLDQTNIMELLTNFQKSFVSFPTPPKVDDQRFKAYLTETLANLTLAATNARVALPGNFAFGFTMQQQAFNYPAGNLVPWMQQLVEIKSIFALLYQAKVNSIESFQRIRVSGTDDSSDYLDASKVTNGLLIATPYQVTFQCFGRELANVLESLAQSSNCYIVKTLSVQHAFFIDTSSSVQNDMMDAPVMQDLDAEGKPVIRPGRRNGPGQPPTPVQPQAPTQPSTPVTRRAVPKTVLSESLLRVSIAIDAVQMSSGTVQTNSSAVQTRGGGH